MPDAVIVSTARTPLCKSWRGAFNMTHGATMGGHVLRHAIDRAHLDPAEVDDVLIGCANPEGATGRNIARQIAIRAGCPVTTSGMTINRFCSSGLQTIEYVSKKYGISRERQDQYGVCSQLRAAAARVAGKFDDEIVPMKTTMKVVDKNSGVESLQQT